MPPACQVRINCANRHMDAVGLPEIFPREPGGWTDDRSAQQAGLPLEIIGVQVQLAVQFRVMRGIGQTLALARTDFVAVGQQHRAGLDILECRIFQSGGAAKGVTVVTIRAFVVGQHPPWIWFQIHAGPRIAAGCPASACGRRTGKWSKAERSRRTEPERNGPPPGRRRKAVRHASTCERMPPVTSARFLRSAT